MGRSIKLATLALALVALCVGRTKADSVLVNFEPSEGFTLGQATIPMPLTYSSGGETITFTTSPSSGPALTPVPFTIVSVGTNGSNVTAPEAAAAGLSGQYLEGQATQTEGLTLMFSVPVNTVTFNYYTTGGVSTVPAGATIGANTITYTGGGSSLTILASTTGAFGSPVDFAIDNLLVTFVPEIDPSSATGALTLLGTAVVMFRGRRKAVRA